MHQEQLQKKIREWYQGDEKQVNDALALIKILKRDGIIKACRSQKPKKQKTSSKKLMDECDKLWADIVKARAGYKSELSGKTNQLQAHHVLMKPNLRLRYELKNGICLTLHEHLYGIHSKDPKTTREYERRINKVTGEGNLLFLKTLKNCHTPKSHLWLIKKQLENELRRYE